MCGNKNEVELDIYDSKNAFEFVIYYKDVKFGAK